MRFVIYGAGAVGSIFGAYLTKAGHDAILIGREEHVNKINQAGLRIRNAEGSLVVSLPAVTKPADILFREGDIVFLTTKSRDTEEAATTLAALAPRDIPVFCFQNGVRNEEMVSRHLTTVYGGVVLFSGVYLAAGEIVSTRNDLVGMGKYPAGVDETARAVYGVLTGAGFRCFLHESIMAVKWSKLVINLGMSVNAVTGLSGQESMALKEARELVADITEEGLKVIQAAGIKLGDAPGQPSITERPARLRAMTGGAPGLSSREDMKHRPSLWQDLALKRGKTEIDFLNGEIVALGKQLGMATPLNSLMVRLVKEMEDNRELPGKYSIGDLRQKLVS